MWLSFVHHFGTNKMISWFLIEFHLKRFQQPQMAEIDELKLIVKSIKFVAHIKNVMN
jgi:hypothetical protein